MFQVDDEECGSGLIEIDEVPSQVQFKFHSDQWHCFLLDNVPSQVQFKFYSDQWHCCCCTSFLM